MLVIIIYCNNPELDFIHFIDTYGVIMKKEKTLHMFTPDLYLAR
jgi:hypothetical protein